MSANRPDLPRVTPNTDALDFSGAYTVNVASGGDINAAIDTVIANLTGPVPMGRVVLAASGTWTLTAPIILKNFGSTGWIEITTNATLPALGTRILPSTGATLPTLTIPDTSYGIAPAAGAQGWRVRGLHLKCSLTQDTHAFISCQPTTDSLAARTDLPCRLSFRQNWIQGNGATQTRRFGITMNGHWIEVADNYLVHFNMNGVDYSQQSQSMSASAGLGKIRIENNFLWRSSEGLAFGGANQWAVIDSEQRFPSDITIRRNHIMMPLSYKGTASPSEMCANGIEFKQGRRVLIEGNIIQNVWTDSQPGYGIVIWSCNQDYSGGVCANFDPNTNQPYVQSCDFTVRYNVLLNCSGVVEISGKYSNSCGTKEAIVPYRIDVHDNLAVAYGSAACASPSAANTQHFTAIQAACIDVRIANNTAIAPDSTYCIFLDPATYTRLEIRDNIIGAANCHLVHFPTGDWTQVNTNGDCLYSGNVQIGSFEAPDPDGTNPLLASPTAVGLADYTQGQNQSFSTVPVTNLDAFVVTGTYAGKGADIAAIKSIIAGVEVTGADLPT